jgi:hypothetical protein
MVSVSFEQKLKSLGGKDFFNWSPFGKVGSVKPSVFFAKIIRLSQPQ